MQLRRQLAILATSFLALVVLGACGTEKEAPAAVVAGDIPQEILQPESAEVVQTEAEAELAETAMVLPVLSADPPELTGTQEWLNSEPTSIGELTDSGQVVAIDFWTYTCSNCINTFPALRALHDTYGDAGLTIVGVHSPEFEFEKNFGNLSEAVDKYELEYPVVQDNDYATWRAFGNRYWPSLYLIDSEGQLRYHHIGEGAYQETEQAVRSLLQEAGADLSTVAPFYQ